MVADTGMWVALVPLVAAGLVAVVGALFAGFVKLRSIVQPIHDAVAATPTPKGQPDGPTLVDKVDEMLVNQVRFEGRLRNLEDHVSEIQAQLPLGNGDPHR